MICIGQGLERSIDMEMVDLSTYVVPHLSNLLLNIDLIQHSGHTVATYLGPKIVERPFTLAQDPNFTSRLLSLKFSLFSSWKYDLCAKLFSLNLFYSYVLFRLFEAMSTVDSDSPSLLIPLGG